MKTYRDIEGFFDYEYIYGPIADQVQDGATVVEVGSWLGQSMAYLAQRLQARAWKGRLVAVDGFTGELNQPAHAATIAIHGGTIRGAFDENMRACGVDNMIEVVQDDSAAAAFRFEDGSVDFCFIDAAHDHDSVVRDILAWLPKMRPGGLIAGHDYPCPGVHRAVLECLGSSGYQVMCSCWFKSMPLDLTPQQWRDGMRRAQESAHVTAK